MRIAFCLQYPIHQHGGTETLVRELLGRLSANYEIVLVSPDEPAAFENSPLKPHIGHHIQWDVPKVKAASSRELASQLKAAGVQLAHFHSGGNFGWADRIPGASPFPYVAHSGIACLSTIHLVRSLFEDYCGPAKPLWFKIALFPFAWLGKMHALRHIHTEITVSMYGLRKVSRWYWPLRRRFRCIYHSRLDEESRNRRPMAEREPLILCVGHVAFRKGQPVLAKAFAIVARQFPAWRLLFLGPINDPICAKVVEEAAMQAGVEKQVAMMGSRNDTMEFMAKAAIYVQPSFFEGLPLSLQEGMFSGCACIGTDIPGNVELIEHEVTGLLVPCGQPKPLAQALTRIMSDVELRERLAARGQESIVEKGMTAQRMARQYDQLYQTVLAGRMNLAL